MGSSGRSSGGGGASQSVDYPEYQKVIQADWLAGGEYDKPSDLATLGEGKSITALINLALDNSPYEEAVAFDPESKLNDMVNAVKNFLPRLDKEIDAYLTYVEDYVNTLAEDSSLADAESILSATDVTSFISDYQRDGSLNQLSFVPDDFVDNTNPELYYVDGSLDEALAYVRSMDTTEDVENELSRFNSQMREINAVHSSAFAVGNQIIASGLMKTKAQLQSDLAKYKSDKMAQYVQLKTDVQYRYAELQNKIGQLNDAKAQTVLKIQLEGFRQHIEPVLQVAQLNLNKQQSVAEMKTKAHGQVFGAVADSVQSRTKLMIEVQRMALVALKEETEENLRIETKDAMWSTDIFQGAANVMASIAGGTVTTPEDSAGKTPSGLGGALSGAAAGASIGTSISPGYGTAIGAVIGGIGGALSG